MTEESNKKESEEGHIIQMIKEINAIKEKYKIPKGMLFMPDRLEFSVKRTGYNKLHLVDREFFDYLLSYACFAIIPFTINALVQFGIPEQKIERIGENGVQIVIDGNVLTCTATVVSEMLAQKKYQEEDFEKLRKGLKSNIETLTQMSDQVFDWNEESFKQFSNTMSLMVEISKNHPEINQEMMTVIEKHKPESKKLIDGLSGQ
jgi:hypothetical protein